LVFKVIIFSAVSLSFIISKNEHAGLREYVQGMSKYVLIKIVGNAYRVGGDTSGSAQIEVKGRGAHFPPYLRILFH
jgi:hypothetical protein